MAFDLFGPAQDFATAAWSEVAGVAGTGAAIGANLGLILGLWRAWRAERRWVPRGAGLPEIAPSRFADIVPIRAAARSAARARTAPAVVSAPPSSATRAPAGPALAVREARPAAAPASPSRAPLPPAAAPLPPAGTAPEAEASARLPGPEPVLPLFAEPPGPGPGTDLPPLRLDEPLFPDLAAGADRAERPASVDAIDSFASLAPAVTDAGAGAALPAAPSEPIPDIAAPGPGLAIAAPGPGPANVIAFPVTAAEPAAGPAPVAIRPPPGRRAATAGGAAPSRRGRAWAPGRGLQVAIALTLLSSLVIVIPTAAAGLRDGWSRELLIGAATRLAALALAAGPALAYVALLRRSPQPGSRLRFATRWVIGCAVVFAGGAASLALMRLV